MCIYVIFEYSDKCTGAVDSDLDPELGIAGVLVLLACIMNWISFFLHMLTPCPPAGTAGQDEAEQPLLDENPSSSQGEDSPAGGEHSNVSDVENSATPS